MHFALGATVGAGKYMPANSVAMRREGCGRDLAKSENNVKVNVGGARPQSRGFFRGFDVLSWFLSDQLHEMTGRT